MVRTFDLDEVFALHDDPQIWVEMVAKRYPVLYIEPFYRDPDRVREYALDCRFDHTNPLYPGRHSILSAVGEAADRQVHPAITEVKAFIAAIISAESGVACDHRDIYTDFSLITTPARELVKRQKHPHTDANPVMALIYLNPQPGGGTVFYRNRALDMSAVVSEDDRRRMEEFMLRAPDSKPQPDFAMAYSDLWERIYTIEGRYNCFAGFPPCIPHRPESTLPFDPAEPATWRLTQRVTVDAIESYPVT